MTDEPIDRLVDAILPHIPFDGWSEPAFRAAAESSGVGLALARSLCPRGATDLAAASHRRGDADMAARLHASDLGALRFRDRVATAVRLRIEAAGDKDVVRRATAHFALPQNLPEGTRLIWGTADAIWTALGDTSDDLNWYTKRAILSGVYSSSILFWLGDDSSGHQATAEFVDRRIADVMAFEALKAGVRDNPVLKPLALLADRLAARVRAPLRVPPGGLPGFWQSPSAGGDGG